MGKRYVHNDLDRVVFQGGVMIPPGEGREVDEDALGLEASTGAAPAEVSADDPAAALAAAVAQLLAHPLKELVPMLADLPDETLAELARAEGEHATPRKTLLAAIGELQLERAQAKAGAPS